MALVVLFLVVSCFVLKVNCTHKVPHFFPVPLFNIINLTFIVAGGVFYIFFIDYIDDFYNLNLSDLQLINAMMYLLMLVCAFNLGVLTFHLKFKILTQSASKNTINFKFLINKYYFLFVFLSFLPIFLMLLGGGVFEVFLRYEYISLKIPAFVNLGRNSSILGVIICGVLVSANSRFKIIPIIVFSLYLVLFFSFASRIFAMLPIFYLVGQLLYAFMVSKKNKYIRYKFIFVLFLTPFLLQVPLLFRGLMPQGLIPFFAFVSDHGITSIIFSQDALINFFSNLFFYVPLTAYVIDYGYLSVSDLAISLHPLPGSAVGWYDVYERFRVSIFIPFNAPGELLNSNVLIAFLYYWLLGVYFSFLGVSILKYFENNNLFRAVLILTLAFSIIFTATQYNLRSVTRLIYYCAFVQIMAYFIFDRKWRFS